MVVLVDEQHLYYGRKHITTTNCMCTCDFDIKFTLECVGQEGSTYDTKAASIMRVTTSQKLQFVCKYVV